MTRRVREAGGFRLGLWPAVACGLLLLLASPAGAATSLTYHLGDAAALTDLTVATFPPHSLEKGPIDKQAPTAEAAVTGLDIVISTQNEFDCGSGEVLAAMTKANQPASAGGDGDAESCLFAADLQIVTTSGKQDVLGGCDDWLDDVTYCWVEGDVGQFWLRRKGPDAKEIELILGPFETVTVETQAANGEGTAEGSDDGSAPMPIPTFGIMLDTPASASGEPIADVWLRWPAKLLTIAVHQ